MAAASPVTDFRERGVRILPLDPLLLLAALGLTAASLYMVGTATQDDIPGDPNYYVTRQAGYAGVGILLMLLISRFDYSRLREWKIGIYGVMIGAILLVYALGFSARGSKRAIEIGFFNFQASELGKLLLVLSLSAFVVDRMRRLDDRETTSRIMLFTLIPAMLVIGQPDLGSGPRVPRDRPGRAVRGRDQVDPLRDARRARRGRGGDRARRGARRRRGGAQAVPGGPPHGFPQPHQQPGRRRATRSTSR